jgi:tRNA(fMet)-specific endonuclease VapC
MTVYIFDTDHLSLYGRKHTALITNLRVKRIKLITTVVNVEEQLRGRLAQVAEAKSRSQCVFAYQRLVETLLLLSDFEILFYDENAEKEYQLLRKQGLRVGSQDLRIASIVIAYGGVLLTRNCQDFEKIPGLLFEDWSI